MRVIANWTDESRNETRQSNLFLNGHPVFMQNPLFRIPTTKIPAPSKIPISSFHSPLLSIPSFTHKNGVPKPPPPLYPPPHLLSHHIPIRHSCSGPYCRSLPIPRTFYGGGTDSLASIPNNRHAHSFLGFKTEYLSN